MLRALWWAPLALIVGCGQEIIVIECDGHVPDDTDAGPRPDLGFDDSGNPIYPDASTDAGTVDGTTPDATPNDSGNDDAGTNDAGANNCPGGSPYCISRVDVTLREAAVRTSVVLQPVLDRTATVTYRTESANLMSRRRAGLPALVLSDISYALVTDANTGATSFILNDVPTWFATTTFVVRIYAKGPNGADPEVYADAEVIIKGNFVFSGPEVYAVASDGRPARSQNFTQGRFISGTTFVRGAEDLVMARDGTLLVYDGAQTPPRIRRFELTGENSLRDDFAFEDANQMPYITSGEAGRGFTQLANGEVALLVVDSGATPDSQIVIWNENGTFNRRLLAVNPTMTWAGLVAGDNGELVTIERESNGRIVRIDPANGTVHAMPIAASIANAWNLTRASDGNYYVGFSGSIVRVTPAGSRQMVAQLPGSTVDYWQFLTPFGQSATGEAQILASRDYSSSDSNVALISGTQYVSWLRLTSSNGPSVLPAGLAYLQ